jgi:hypothetical protein
MHTICKLRKESEFKNADQRLYRSMIGILLYVTASRLDVMQAVGQVVRFQVALKETHVMAVKRILKYLKETKYFRLWYPKVNDLSLVDYTCNIPNHTQAGCATSSLLLNFLWLLI